METLQIDILDPKAKKMLEDMAVLELIGIKQEINQSNREKLKKSLNRIQNLGVFNKVDDPLQWQNEIRNEWK